METIPQNEIKLKYNIKLKLAALEESQRVRIQRKIRKTFGGMGAATFSRYINCRTNDKVDIPGLVLRLFANHLHCTVDELYNNENE
jgi:hypothetical protein